MNSQNKRIYPKLIYFILIILSLVMLFSVVIIQDAKMKNEQNKLSGFATEIDKTNNPAVNHTNEQTTPRATPKTNIPKKEKGEMYSTQSYIFYYVLLIGIIAGIFITFSVLKSTVVKNIEREEKDREF
jgi:hypothetical protein